MCRDVIQAAIIARKKEVAAEKLREAREELERYEREASEKQEYMKQCDGADTIKGEDVRMGKGLTGTLHGKECIAVGSLPLESPDDLN